MSPAASSARPAPWILALWFAAALVSTVCGIGGGLYAVPILHFLLGVPLKRAVASSLVVVGAMTLAGTVAEALRADSALSWPIIALLCLGAFVGARLGKAAVERLPVRRMRQVFVVVLVAVGAKILWTRGASGAADFHYAFDAWSAALIVGYGFLGGFVAPILGIGGGLIVVPALYLTIDGVDYLHARACSTAMSTVTSAQLAWMYWQSGGVERRASLWLGAVALFAGVLGVALVHQAGWSEAARWMLGLTLFGVAARFAWDLRARAEVGS